MHREKLDDSTTIRKSRSVRHGMLLVESAVALSLLTMIGLILLKLSLNMMQPRQWVVQQTLSDAYLTFERARAERISFEELVANNSPWPAFPTTSVEEVEIGQLPYGVPVHGMITRTRRPDPNNLPIDSGTGTELTNPAMMKTWQVQSVLTYTIGNVKNSSQVKHYAKSRTVLRSQ